MSVSITVTLTEAEYARVLEEAAEKGLTPAQYVKRYPITATDFDERYEYLKMSAIAMPENIKYSVMSLFSDWDSIERGTKLSLGRNFFHLVERGELKPVVSAGKNSSNVQLYETSKRIYREKHYSHHKIYGSTTDEALRALDEMALNPENVKEVYIFFSEREAIYNGFYNLSEERRQDKLSAIETARFIVIMDNDEEFWFEGLLCGYVGKGSNGTIKALERLGIIEVNDEKAQNTVYGSESLHYYRFPLDVWNVEMVKPMDKEVTEYAKKYNFKDIDSKIYQFNDKVVLTQAVRYYREIDKKTPLPLELLLVSADFIAEPVSVEFISREEAINNGYHTDYLGEKLVYQIIIRDRYKRELWLSYPFEEIPYKEQDMRGLIEKFGLEIPKEELPGKIKKWLSVKPKWVGKTFERGDD